MTHSTATRLVRADAERGPGWTRRDRADIAPASWIDRNALGAVAGTATILAVKISMLWVALQPL
jgi:hypothetical protein